MNPINFVKCVAIDIVFIVITIATLIPMFFMKKALLWCLRNVRDTEMKAKIITSLVDDVFPSITEMKDELVRTCEGFGRL